MEYTKAHSGLSSWYKKLQYLFKKATRKQKTYILPTKFGLAYGLLCFVLLLMGMAYANNLVYIVCFYLTVMGLALAKITNDCMDRANIEKVYIKDVFAEDNQILYVLVKNTGKESLKQIQVKIAKQKVHVEINLRPEESQVVEVLWTPLKRGTQKIPTIRLQSTYPGGLFGAWKILKGTEDIIVFPKRRGQKEFPIAGLGAQDAIGVLREIRDYKGGDSPKRIHWRSLAKLGQLRTLVHEGDEGQTCHFDWQQVQQFSLESRLEQLALWISTAETQGLKWNLKLPHKEYSSHEQNAARSALCELAQWKSAA